MLEGHGLGDEAGKAMPQMGCGIEGSGDDGKRRMHYGRRALFSHSISSVSLGIPAVSLEVGGDSVYLGIDYVHPDF